MATVLIVAIPALAEVIKSLMPEGWEITTLKPEEFAEKVLNDHGFRASLSTYSVFAVNAITEEDLLSTVNYLDAYLEVGWKLVVACIRVHVTKALLPKGCTSVILRDITPNSVNQALTDLHVIS